MQPSNRLHSNYRFCLFREKANTYYIDAYRNRKSGVSSYANRAWKSHQESNQIDMPCSNKWRPTLRFTNSSCRKSLPVALLEPLVVVVAFTIAVVHHHRHEARRSSHVDWLARFLVISIGWFGNFNTNYIKNKQRAPTAGLNKWIGEPSGWDKR